MEQKIPEVFILIFFVMGVFLFFKIRGFFHMRMGRRAKEFENRGKRHYRVSEQTVDDVSYFDYGDDAVRNSYQCDWTGASIFSAFLTILIMVVVFVLLRSYGVL